ncbi:UDP-galactose/UDP-glucose transporter 7-like [Penaeus japonicus]|uniref:UDP-galactose/UDP-glucose transporter 7-like n=1 Tax=Penaeus japonicus TaxID=27405 RepID=UPI001C70EA4D|nr:UDP-galactose/UDP-glucose transporter 7-like [Penaeus japonicus]
MPSAAQATAVAAAVLYGCLSLSMAFVNKAVLSQYRFNYPFFLMACQMLLTMCVLEALRASGRVSLPPLTVASVKAFLLPSLCYSMHATLSLLALEGMNIPMYGALKRCTPLVNLVLAVVYLKKPLPSPLLLTSVFVITFGCVIAGFSDPSFEGFAYAMGSLSVVTQATYLTLVQQCGENQFSPLHILHLNSCISFTPFMLLTFALGEVDKVLDFKYLNDTRFLMVLLLLLLFGLSLNFSLFLCTMLNSALTTSIVGVIKSVLQTVIGFFVFGGIVFHPVNITGIILNTIGGFMYTYTKYKEEWKKKVKIDLGDAGIQHSGWELKEKLGTKR